MINKKHGINLAINNARGTKKPSDRAGYINLLDSD